MIKSKIHSCAPCFFFLGHCWGQLSHIQQPSAGGCNVSSVQHLSQVDIHPPHCIWWGSAVALTGQTSQHREWFCPCSPLPPSGGPHGETKPCKFLHVIYTVYQVFSHHNGGHGCLWVWSVTQKMFGRWRTQWHLIITTSHFHRNTSLFIKTVISYFSPLDWGEPDGHDQFPGGTREDAGDCGAAGQKEFEEGGGALLSTPGLQHLWSAGLHRLWAYRLCPWLRGDLTHTNAHMHPHKCTH